MATKTFNDICVEYAHQLGKGLPLTAPEMCNALVMYLNQQVTVMNQMVQTALNAVAEVQKDLDEGEFATVSGDNVFNGDNTFTKSIKAGAGVQTGNVILSNSNIKNMGYTYNYPQKSGTLAVLDDIPDLSTPASVTYAQETGATITYGTDNAKEFVLPIIAGDNVTIDADESNTHLVISATGGTIPTNIVTTDTEQTITGKKTFTGDITCNRLNAYLDEGYVGCGIMVNRKNSTRMVCIADTVILFRDSTNYLSLSPSSLFTGNYDLMLPVKNGTIATLDDVPNLDNYIGTMHIVQGTAGSGIAVHDTVKASPYTKYGYDKIETYGNSNSLQYTLNIPNKNGTIATLDDISPSSGVKYFTRVIFHNTDEDTQYILFSCITDTDMSANTSYQNVIDLLNSLGATTNERALPCNGKTVSGGIVVGVYTDGTNIIVFDTDNTPEELTMSSEIKFISK